MFCFMFTLMGWTNSQKEIKLSLVYIVFAVNLTRSDATAVPSSYTWQCHFLWVPFSISQAMIQDWYVMCDKCTLSVV